LVSGGRFGHSGRHLCRGRRWHDDASGTMERSKAAAFLACLFGLFGFFGSSGLFGLYCLSGFSAKSDFTRSSNQTN
jgi:hypothetical protein